MQFCPSLFLEVERIAHTNLSLVYTQTIIEKSVILVHLKL